MLIFGPAMDDPPESASCGDAAPGTPGSRLGVVGCPGSDVGRRGVELGGPDAPHATPTIGFVASIAGAVEGRVAPSSERRCSGEFPAVPPPRRGADTLVASGGGGYTDPLAANSTRTEAEQKLSRHVAGVAKESPLAGSTDDSPLGELPGSRRTIGLSRPRRARLLTNARATRVRATESTFEPLSRPGPLRTLSFGSGRTAHIRAL